MFARLRPLAPILAFAPILALAAAAPPARAAAWVDSPLLAPKDFVGAPDKVSPIEGLVPDEDDPARARADAVALATDVPEPATWTMMILGFGLVGASARRRSAPRGHWRDFK